MNINQKETNDDLETNNDLSSDENSIASSAADTDDEPDADNNSIISSEEEPADDAELEEPDEELKEPDEELEGEDEELEGEDEELKGEDEELEDEELEKLDAELKSEKLEKPDEELESEEPNDELEEQDIISDKAGSIPIKDIYKIHILNSDGILERIHVFCANEFDHRQMTELFSDTQIAYYKALDPPVEIIFSEHLIHKEDTIQMVKKKIIIELSNYTQRDKNVFSENPKKHKSQISISLDELYLFTETKADLDMNKIYQMATKNETIPLTKERFFQYALNLNINPFISEKNDILERDTFTYKDWSMLSKSGIHEIFVPLGMRFQDEYEYLFSANPHHIQVWTETVRFEMSPKNPLFLFENTVLLNYGRSTNITVCLAKNVFEYAARRGIDQEYLCNLYFPALYKRGLFRADLLNEASFQLIEETAAKITPGLIQYYETLDTFHEIYWKRKPNAELPYIERGIRSYSVTILPSDFKHTLPLDLLFKNMHATKDMPFIKYNPGNRRENMYRLYSEQISANGKKVPILSETMIMRLSKETGRGHQITMYLKSQTDQEIYINIDGNSHIQITGELNTLMTPIALEKLLLKIVNPIISQLNSVLQSSGYILRSFEGLTGTNIAKSIFTYQAILPIEKNVALQKQMAYITCAFDVISTDLSKGAQLRFKRVENFKEMDAQSALITEIYQRSGNYKLVVQALVDNYGLSQEDALLRLAQYSAEHQQLKGKILENPGFPTTLKMRASKNELMIEVKEIVSSEYIDVLHIYIDTILRLTQSPLSTTVSTDKLNKFRKIKSKAEQAAIVQEMAETVENIIAPAGIGQTTDFFKVQPLHFGHEPETLEVNDGEGGFVFDDDFGYEEEGVQEEGEGEGEGQGEEEEEEEEVMGGENTPETDEDLESGYEPSEKYKANIDGMSIKQPTPFFKKMKELDPTLFITEDQGKQYKLYSKSCPSVDKRQPVILTDEEYKRMEKDENLKGAYGKALKYGSNPKKQNWYICPRYWCLKTNSVISEADVKAGKCGAIIPQNAPTVPKGAYVYEFQSKKHIGPDGKYIQYTPGFMDKEKSGKHPDGLCIPCCFKKEWDSGDQKGRREQCARPGEDDDEEGAEAAAAALPGKPRKALGQKVISYIIGAINYPIPAQRWGFLPMAIQLFLGTDNTVVTDPQNPSLIRPNEQCLLRYGVEQSDKQSFIGCLAHFYAYKHELEIVPSIQEMRGKLARSLTLDLFLRYHNGNLATIFRPKKVNQENLDIDRYSDTAFYKSIDIENETQLDYLEDTIAAYENFVQYLQNENSVIDHTYLWDIVVDRNPQLMRDGVNLVILKMADNDITEKVQMVCPSNAYSSMDYDPSKETVILIKQEGYYEPIHLYEEFVTIVNSKTDNVGYTLKKGDYIVKDKVFNSVEKLAYSFKQGDVKKSEIVFKKAFLEHTAMQNIKVMLRLIQQTTKKYCAPQSSLPRKYNFKRNLSVLDLIRTLKQNHYRIESQVLNYRNKTIGVRVNKEEDQDLLFVPCFPSNIVDGLKTQMMDDDDLWIDYRNTRDRLLGISLASGGKIPCKPFIKIVDDGLVVGFLTETNQFVQINPPTQNLDEDGIETINHSSYVNDPAKGKMPADKTLTTNKTEDMERVNIIRKINLETQFYNVFRSLIRLLLNNYEYRKIRQTILDTIDNYGITYQNKLQTIERLLRDLTEDSIVFQVFDEKVLQGMEEVMSCITTEDGKCADNTKTTGLNKKYCLTTAEGKCQTVFPKRHLLSNTDNERIYYGRMADELLRYGRIRNFMFQPKTYLNVGNAEFKIRDDELFLLESLLNKEYFRDLVVYNSGSHIEYDIAKPAIAQTYTNDVSLDEQDELLQKSVEKTAMSDYIVDCISDTKSRVIGNEKAGSWRPVFPTTVKEIIFGSSITCSYIPIIYILQEIHKRAGLSIQNVKTALWNGYSPLLELYRDKIFNVLKKQGKRDLIDLIVSGKSTLENVIFSDGYYITDLDWWILCQSTRLPVVFFSSTSLKYLMNSINWLRLGGSGNANERYFFVRSPVDVKLNQPPAYQVLTPAVSFSEMRSDIFLRAERGDAKYIENMQSLQTYLAKKEIIIGRK